MHRRFLVAVGLVLTSCLTVTLSRGADGPEEATVTDAEGKEAKVSALKFGTGTRRLTWMGDSSGTTEDTQKGPLALELREPHSTTYSKGIITLVPVSSIDSIKYDYDKQVASVAVKGVAEPVAGTLQFKGINVLGFSGSVDGKTTAFSGGAFTKGNIKAVAFAGAKPAPKRAGAPWQIQIDQPKAENPTLTASNIKFLYQFPGGSEILAGAATLRKGEPFKLDETVTEFTPVAVDQNTRMAAVEVQVGGAEKIIIIPQEIERDGKKGTLAGLLGEVEAGWKLFPIHTIKSMKRQKN